VHERIIPSVYLKGYIYGIFQVMKYLGIDFGGKNIGVAVSDDGGQIAFPFKTLKNEGGLITSIKQICLSENIETIVLGKSINDQGEPNQIQKQIENFREVLIAEVKLPVKWQNESFSSVHVLDDAKGRDGGDHAQAAALILQRFLERVNS